MKNFVAHFMVSAGQIVWRSQAYMDVNLPKYEGLTGVLTIKKKWNKRSLNQNALMWEWLTIIGDYIGEDKNEVYRIMTGLYSPKIEVTMGKKKFQIPKGTSKMTKGEMVEFMMNIQVEASQLGITLPTPEDYQKAQLIN